MLGHEIVKQLFCFPKVKVFTFLCYIYWITLLELWVLDMQASVSVLGWACKT